MKKNFICFWALVGLTACNDKLEKLPELLIDDVSAIDLKYEIPYDSIFDRSEMIHLAANNEFVIGEIKGVLESKADFFILGKQQIARFNKQGKFLNTIGNKGKGPGEYLSPWRMDVDEAKQLVYVMDYYGRKMLRYHFNGTFDKKYNLPENYSVTNFQLYQGEILYISDVNSVSPEISICDLEADKQVDISLRDREMLANEAFFGSNFTMGNKEEPQFYHYFNDTVFTITDKKLEPKYLLKFGKLIPDYEELVMGSSRKNSPRAQVNKMIQKDQLTFIRYGVSRFNGKRTQTLLTGLYRNDLKSFSPSVNISNNKKPLLSIATGVGISSGYGNSILRVVNAIDVLAAQPDLAISKNDNPFLIKYHLK